MVYYKIPLIGGLDYPAGSILICSYTYNDYQYCKFERVTEVGSGWVSITEAEFNVRCPEFPEPEHTVEVESADHPGCFYRMVDGAKEWINPPMVLNEHYRTTERCGGKPVYVAYVKLEGDYAPECLIGVNLRAIRASGYMIYDRNGFETLLPLHSGQDDYDLSVQSVVYGDDTELQVSVKSPQFDPEYKCYAQVWYIHN